MSIEDARELTDGAVLEADVCIVGAGAAGITLATELDGKGLGVLVLESGGDEVHAQTARMYQGKVFRGPEKTPKDRYLTGTRLRYFGGTTNHWDGACAPFTTRDFDGVPWHPLMRWPVTREEMEPFYNRAAPIVDVAPFDYDFDDLAKRDRPLYELPEQSGLVYRHFQMSSGPRLGPRFRSQIKASENVTLWQWANVVDVVLDEAGARVVRLECKTLSGIRFSVEADNVVMACGGVENARLLLNANGQAPDGIGNDRGNVGRYFMDHFSFNALRGAFFGDLPHMKAYERRPDDEHGHIAFNVFSLAPEVRDEMRVLDSNLRISRDRKRDKRKVRDELPGEKANARKIRQVDAEEAAAVASIFSGTAPGDSYAARIRLVIESEPHEQNGVSLTDDKDQLGLRRVRLDWALTELDRHTIETTVDWFSRMSAIHMPARIAADSFPRFSSYQCHHVGTLRMGDDPATSVVDSKLRVHGMSNFYIAGSAVFPTITAVNPTFSIVAFSVRLADHLAASAG